MMHPVLREAVIQREIAERQADYVDGEYLESALLKLTATERRVGAVIAQAKMAGLHPQQEWHCRVEQGWYKRLKRRLNGFVRDGLRILNSPKDRVV